MPMLHCIPPNCDWPFRRMVGQLCDGWGYLCNGRCWLVCSRNRAGRSATSRKSRDPAMRWFAVSAGVRCCGTILRCVSRRTWAPTRCRQPIGHSYRSPRKRRQDRPAARHRIKAPAFLPVRGSNAKTVPLSARARDISSTAEPMRLHRSPGSAQNRCAVRPHPVAT